MLVRRDTDPQFSGADLMNFFAPYFTDKLINVHFTNMGLPT
jgi:hypothetical protein